MQALNVPLIIGQKALNFTPLITIEIQVIEPLLHYPYGSRMSSCQPPSDVDLLTVLLGVAGLTNHSQYVQTSALMSAGLSFEVYGGLSGAHASASSLNTDLQWTCSAALVLDCSRNHVPQTSGCVLILRIPLRLSTTR